MSTQFCDRYRERNVSNPREMLALRNTQVDLKKWQPISFGRVPSSKISALAAQGYVIIEYTTDLLTRAARRYRKELGRDRLAGTSKMFRSGG